MPRNNLKSAIWAYVLSHHCERPTITEVAEAVARDPLDHDEGLAIAHALRELVLERKLECPGGRVGAVEPPTR